MAKFRSNHKRVGKGSTGAVVKVGVFSALIAGLFFIFNLFTGGDFEKQPADKELEYYLPAGGEGTVIQKATYALSYNETHEQAEWVAYKLSRSTLQSPFVNRTDDFRPDPDVPSGSADPNDYRHSGYDRGHLLPAADRAYSTSAMSETFLMSNISPQARQFNGGIWRELEELTREWAKDAGELYVVTGPLLNMEPKGVIGNNEVTIPGGYFKVLLDLEEPQLKAIGFVLPNTISYEPLYKFVASVDEVEAMTGFDFFADFLPDEVEAALESKADVDLWRFDKEKFRKRIDNWNNR
ncbi:MAG: DNA/RNA non-specific endonuclease [Phaeodactylibacter sp.]|uniref:DNA/RNA non-specific endonuclease n=1 Tax=Phaeodactylibacter sp. TaxID=1940289 RepID=UPI0032EEC949